MTVGELIERLGDFGDHLEVYVDIREGPAKITDVDSDSTGSAGIFVVIYQHGELVEE